MKRCLPSSTSAWLVHACSPAMSKRQAWVQSKPSSTPMSSQKKTHNTTTNQLIRQASPGPRLVDCVLWSTPVVKRCLFHPTVHTVRRLFSSTRLCLNAGPRLRFQPLCLLMAARQTSIITTTAPPAPALAANLETEPAVFTPDVVFPTRVEQNPPSCVD